MGNRNFKSSSYGVSRVQVYRIPEDDTGRFKIGPVVPFGTAGLRIEVREVEGYFEQRMDLYACQQLDLHSTVLMHLNGPEEKEEILERYASVLERNLEYIFTGKEKVQR